MSLSVSEVRARLIGALNAMPASAEELRELDAALGDGDLGVTVKAGSLAAADAIAKLPPDAALGDVLNATGKAFSTANPSTFGALVGGGLLAAAKTVVGSHVAGRAEALAMGRAVAARIAERGKSQLGDKTVLDALVPSLDTLEAFESGVDERALLDAMIDTAQRQVRATAALQSKKGRAAWVQERSIGHADPGATAWLRFLQAWRG
ncbi:DAK2 domain-containing protein [Paraburkholderia sp. CNPSo 3076]|uniref:DAK2 domain-containing protein n=1 Tax=Paraburkholderia sp. CNPSo 3076 TaxID=2940936 RepID=UPI00225391BA|nr:DAK2 domain-containing protein [Paraburkholderia sp. CNPSo 3076]MCX5543791.1 DAK2 domain-containing protein [Paraburkholderia sp. CNPSo 3076]